jgi:hypothetical protein
MPKLCYKYVQEGREIKGLKLYCGFHQWVKSIAAIDRQVGGRSTDVEIDTSMLRPVRTVRMLGDKSAPLKS